MRGKVIGGVFVSEEMQKELFNEKFLQERYDSSKKEMILGGLFGIVLFLILGGLVLIPAFGIGYFLCCLGFVGGLMMLLYITVPYTSTVGLNEEFDNRNK